MSTWRGKLISFAIGAVALLGVAYWLLTGPKDLSRYPAPETSPYKLPWPAGVSWLCIQSNRGVVSHRGYEEFAFDFKMPEGSDVCAAREGVVVTIDMSHDGHGLNAPNNWIAIEHPDDTRGSYLHLQKAGSLVKLGDRVTQGQKIARSGHVGKSMTPHLHFHVISAEKVQTIPISFADVTTDAGVPRMFRKYTSGNR
jgi:murein DD-endopeptidase MepM/ murein hydrolase activator NlpD